jgi:lysocardiolipin and lysophospholipid acyltransferase
MSTCNYGIFALNGTRQDLGHMRSIYQYLTGSGYATTLLLFPEGTDLSPSNVEKARKYAESRRLRPNEYVLQPKVAGFLGERRCQTLAWLP